MEVVRWHSPEYPLNELVKVEVTKHYYPNPAGVSFHTDASAYYSVQNGDLVIRIDTAEVDRRIREDQPSVHGLFWKGCQTFPRILPAPYTVTVRLPNYFFGDGAAAETTSATLAALSSKVVNDGHGRR